MKKKIKCHIHEENSNLIGEYFTFNSILSKQYGLYISNVEFNYHENIIELHTDYPISWKMQREIIRWIFDHTQYHRFELKNEDHI